MKLSQLAGYKTNPVIMALRYETWLMKEEPYSAEAIEFMGRELTKPDRDRTGHFSASSLGSCARQQQFTFLGMPKLPETAQRMAVLVNGKHQHLKWQMAGLTDGFLPKAEVPISDNIWGLKGTMDGILYEGSVFEGKSQNSHGFRDLRQADYAKSDHVFQAGTYMLVEDREQAVIFYENKDNCDTKEFVVTRSRDLMNQVIERVEDLLTITEHEELAPMLPSCAAGEGWQYNYCAYRKVCPLMKSFAHAKETANAHHD